jgi:hypothetical protein
VEQRHARGVRACGRGGGGWVLLRKGAEGRRLPRPRLQRWVSPASLRGLPRLLLLMLLMLLLLLMLMLMLLRQWAARERVAQR